MTWPVAGFSTSIVSVAWIVAMASGAGGEPLDPGLLRRPVARVGGQRADLVDHVHALADLAEHRVLAVQPRRGRGGDDEELRAVGVRPGVRHRQRALDDLVVVDLVLEGVARAA